MIIRLEDPLYFFFSLLRFLARLLPPLINHLKEIMIGKSKVKASTTPNSEKVSVSNRTPKHCNKSSLHGETPKHCNKSTVQG